VNLMVPDLGTRVAFAVASRPRGGGHHGAAAGRQLFVVPWRGHTLIGTGHYLYQADPADYEPRPEDSARFLNEVNDALPGRSLDWDDVELVQSGLLPVTPGSTPARIRLLREHRIIHHSKHGAPEAITVVSVKYTTGRLIAERVLDLVVRRLGIEAGPCVTASTLLRRYGTSVDAYVLEHLVRYYGTGYERILAYRDAVPDWDARPVPGIPVIKAQWLHGIREEMALRADDLVHRRTEVGPRGMASPTVIESAAEILAAEFRAARS
jgi:glycerol-3-phosphate dehydrogenase